MGIAYIALALLITFTSTFVLIFPTYQVAFAQVDEGTVQIWNQTIGVVLGGVIGTASSLIGIALTNRHNMKVKKQELKHSLSIELLKHRIDCYALAFKYIDPASYFSSKTPYGDIQELYDNINKWAEQEKGILLMSHDSYASYIQVLKAITEIKRSTARQANISQENADRLSKAIIKFSVSLLDDIGASEGRKSKS